MLENGFLTQSGVHIVLRKYELRSKKALQWIYWMWRENKPILILTLKFENYNRSFVVGHPARSIKNVCLFVVFSRLKSERRHRSNETFSINISATFHIQILIYSISFSLCSSSLFIACNFGYQLLYGFGRWKKFCFVITRFAQTSINEFAVVCVVVGHDVAQSFHSVHALR